MLEFIRVLEEDHTYQQEVFEILKKCGRDMYEKDSLTHWLEPYSLAKIKEDTKGKSVFIVKNKDYTVATFMLSYNRSVFFNDDEKFIYLSKFGLFVNSWGKPIK